MQYIIIETFNVGFPEIVRNEYGEPKMFDSKDYAIVERDMCQNGIIVLLQDINDTIQSLTLHNLDDNEDIELLFP